MPSSATQKKNPRIIKGNIARSKLHAMSWTHNITNDGIKSGKEKSARFMAWQALAMCTVCACLYAVQFK